MDDGPAALLGAAPAKPVPPASWLSAFLPSSGRFGEVAMTAQGRALPFASTAVVGHFETLNSWNSRPQSCHLEREDKCEGLDGGDPAPERAPATALPRDLPVSARMPMP